MALAILVFVMDQGVIVDVLFVADHRDPIEIGSDVLPFVVEFQVVANQIPTEGISVHRYDAAVVLLNEGIVDQGGGGPVILDLVGIDNGTFSRKDLRHRIGQEAGRPWLRREDRRPRGQPGRHRPADRQGSRASVRLR